MATVGTTPLTLADWAKKLDPDGKIARVAEILNQTNQILDDMVWLEGNLPTGHRTTIRTDMPSAVWRKLNYGVIASKALTRQIDDVAGILEARAEVDKELADLNGNTSAFRLSEDRAHIEGMNQTMASTLFYGDTTQNPERFLGLAPRYNALATPGVVNCGGSGNACTSVWLVCWGPNTVHGFFPKASKAGLLHQDLGEIDLFDSQTPPGRYRGYSTLYQWKAGLCVRDWRYVARICNINTSSTSNNLITDNLVDAISKIPNPDMGNLVIYCNRTINAQLAKAAMNKSTAALSLDETFGKKIINFWGYPIRTCEQILNTEAALT